jgi:hypothetical protein
VNPLGRLRVWRRDRILARHPLDDATWSAQVAAWAPAAALPAGAQRTLRDLATLFLHAKRFSGAHGLVVSEAMRAAIAMQACLPVLELGIDWLRGWRSVVLYPESFFVDLEEADEHGVVHRGRDERIGEAWEGGPLILSWADATPGHAPYGDGTNVVLHEIAHKLDQLNGDTNGYPPLHRDMDPSAWRQTLGDAYAALQQAVERGTPTWVDPYAAETPGEFFAVVSEHFFEAPAELQAEMPAVYDQLTRFYRRDPRVAHG